MNRPDCSGRPRRKIRARAWILGGRAAKTGQRTFGLIVRAGGGRGLDRLDGRSARHRALARNGCADAHTFRPWTVAPSASVAAEGGTGGVAWALILDMGAVPTLMPLIGHIRCERHEALRSSTRVDNLAHWNRDRWLYRSTRAAGRGRAGARRGGVRSGARHGESEANCSRGTASPNCPLPGRGPRSLFLQTLAPSVASIELRHPRRRRHLSPILSLPCNRCLTAT
jgi:hypothetical protein